VSTPPSPPGSATTTAITPDSTVRIAVVTARAGSRRPSTRRDAGRRRVTGCTRVAARARLPSPGQSARLPHHRSGDRHGAVGSSADEVRPR
jgi:hypothetical protein